DMRKMGGIYKLVPVTYILMIIGTLALTGVGIPGIGGFAGFYSKDAIIEAAYVAGAAGHNGPAVFAFWAGLIAAAMTSFYSWRLIFMTFHGKHRGEKEVLDHAHESPFNMTIPLVILAVGAVLAGVIFYDQFMLYKDTGFWGQALPEGHGKPKFPTWVLWAPFVVTVLGFVLAWFMYIRDNGIEKRIAGQANGGGGIFYKFLLNKWYIDELYEATIIRGARKLGDIFWKIGDIKIIDGLGPNGFAAASLAVGKKLSKLQSGYLYHYAFVMLLGVAGLIAFVSMNAPG
ncbi:MAG: NADH-quinone oxidoreductase subunit L, partial [Robiginitomaculum sp.]|nr:NADH-quinone oxidoreductase subunit L [Robiginitomaculum sp.]